MFAWAAVLAFCLFLAMPPKPKDKAFSRWNCGIQVNKCIYIWPMVQLFLYINTGITRPSFICLCFAAPYPGQSILIIYISPVNGMNLGHQIMRKVLCKTFTCSGLNVYRHAKGINFISNVICLTETNFNVVHELYSQQVRNQMWYNPIINIRSLVT